MSGKNLNKMVKEMEEMEGRYFTKAEKIVAERELQKELEPLETIVDDCPTNEELDEQKMKSIKIHNYQKPEQPILINRRERRRRERINKRKRRK